MNEYANASTTLPTQQLYIGGRYVDATSGETFETDQPRHEPGDLRGAAGKPR